MELDLDLVRSLLAQVERQQSNPELTDVEIGNFDPESVSDHLRLLDGLGYVVAVRKETFAGEAWKPVRITWKGADFLARAQDDGCWERAKKMVEERVVGNCDFKLEVLKGLLDSVAEELPGGN